MKRLLPASISIMAISMVLCAFESVDAAESESTPQEQQQMQQADPQFLLGTWRDDQNRFWFRIDEIVGNEVRAARFWLAHLKEGRIDGDTLTLTSESCLPFIGCYEFTHSATLLGPDSMDMFGHSGICTFSHGCREEGDVVNHLLMRE